MLRGIFTVYPPDLNIATRVNGMDQVDKIKVPLRASGSKVERALSKIPLDGKWHKLLTMGFSTAEQTARSYNVPGGKWAYGYTHENDPVTNELVSVLWVQWNG